MSRCRTEQEKGRLYYCVGLPRSGKSTRCDSWVRNPDIHIDYTQVFELGDLKAYPFDPQKPFVPRPRAIVCGDDFRQALHGNAYRVEAEGTVFAMMDVATRALLNRGFDVIVDETCTTEQTLLRYLRLDPNAEPVFVDTPEEECVERALASNKPFLVGPIRRMAAQLQHLRTDWDATVKRLKSYLDSRKAQDIPC
jgi:hypothetical protein